MSITPFSINVPDSVLSDLRERLERTRWAEDYGNEAWAYGTNGTYLRELCDYWRDGFDWRKQEAKINAFKQFKTEIDGIPIHFILQKGNGPKPMPLIMSHGWPWTFWDMQKVIGPLSDPAAHGGNAEDAFDVIVPSLPGYGFSTPLKTTGINFWQTADLWVKLMQDELGYDKFSAYGADWGAVITGQLGHKYADRLYGVHTSLPLPLNLFHGELPEASLFGPEEQGWCQQNINFFRSESGYSAIQTTKPQTLAFALNDSPVAQCSWILEKRRGWSDCGGDVEKVFSKDDLLTTMMIYWATQSGGSSARYYYECVHNPWRPSHDRKPVVEAPTGVAVFENEIIHFPKKWAEEYYNLQRWERIGAGGHFAPMEQPVALVSELREFFRPLRPAA